MYFRPLTDETVAAPNRRLRELLGLDGTVREIAVVHGSYPSNDEEIAVLTRSVLQVLVDFAPSPVAGAGGGLTAQAA